jgi:hypothetical protein
MTVSPFSFSVGKRQRTECETIETECKIENRHDAVAGCSAGMYRPSQWGEATETSLVTSFNPTGGRIQNGKAITTSSSLGSGVTEYLVSGARVWLGLVAFHGDVAIRAFQCSKKHKQRWTATTRELA